MVTCKAAAHIATARRTPNARIPGNSFLYIPTRSSLIKLPSWRRSVSCFAPQSHGIALNGKPIN